MICLEKILRGEKKFAKYQGILCKVYFAKNYIIAQ